MDLLKKIGIGILILSLIIGSVVTLGNENIYDVKVTEKIVKTGKDSSRYLIFTEIDGVERVFENTDSFFKFKFNSSDIYAKLKIGKSYKIRAYGFRIPVISWYENIIDVNLIP